MPSSPRTTVLTVAVAVLWVGYSTVLGIFYSGMPPDPDQSLFDYVGWVLTQGGIPYRDAADHDFPAMFAIHGLSRLIVGSPFYSYRPIDYGLMLLFCGAIVASLRGRVANSYLLVFVPLYQVMYVSSGYWFTGQRDLLGGECLLAAGLLYTRRMAGGKVGWIFIAGFLFWFALMIKPTFATFLPIVLVVDFLGRKQAGRGLKVIALDQLIYLSTIVGLTCGLLLIGWPSGATSGWFDMAILFNAQVYGQNRLNLGAISSVFFHVAYHWWWWYISFAVVGAWLWWKGSDRPALLVILASLAMAIISAFAQGKGFGYHLGGTFPVLALLIAYPLASLIQASSASPTRSAWPARLAMVASFLFVGAGMTSKFDHEYRDQVRYRMGLITNEQYLSKYGYSEIIRMAEFAKSRTKPGDTIWSYNTRLMVNVIAERRLPVRFAHPLLVENAIPPFVHAREWSKEVEAVFRDHPPRLIILSKRPGQDGYDFFSKPNSSSPSNLIERAIRDRYDMVYQAKDLYCFELRR